MHLSVDACQLERQPNSSGSRSEELAAHLQDKEDVSIAQHCELTATILEDPTVVPEDHSALVEAKVMVVETPILCLLSQMAHILRSSHCSCRVRVFLMLD